MLQQCYHVTAVLPRKAKISPCYPHGITSCTLQPQTRSNCWRTSAEVRLPPPTTASTRCRRECLDRALPATICCAACWCPTRSTARLSESFLRATSCDPCSRQTWQWRLQQRQERQQQRRRQERRQRLRKEDGEETRRDLANLFPE